MEIKLATLIRNIEDKTGIFFICDKTDKTGIFICDKKDKTGIFIFNNEKLAILICDI